MVNRHGERMWITAFHDRNNIDVEFENGTSVTGKQYSDFKNGVLRMRKLKVHRRRGDGVRKTERIGETKTMRDGSVCTIEVYRNAVDMDVRFAEGLREHVSYRSFQNGTLLPPRLHERREMKGGYWAEITDYPMADDMTVRFDDGLVVHHVSYRDFREGLLLHPEYKDRYRSEREGMTVMQTIGIACTIVSYNGSTDVLAEFDDGYGTVHTNYDRFEKGLLIPNGMSIAEAKARRNGTAFLGDKRKQKCGQYAEVIAFRKRNDMDVRFDDGTVVEHTKARFFESGEVVNPNQKFEQMKQFREARVGMALRQSNGQMCTIVEYSGSNNITVEFEDGTRRDHQKYANFIRKAIRNPNFKVKSGEKDV